VFGISGFELLIIAVFVLLIFGPDKLPQLAKTISGAMKMFKSAQADMEKLIKAEMITGGTDIFNLDAKPTEEAGEPAVASSTPGGAATVWAATAEDDDEEDEE